MANGIEDFFDPNTNSLNITVPLAVPEEGGPDLVGIGGAAISDLINNQLGFDLTTPQEGSRFIEEGIIGRDPEVVKKIIVDKVNNAPNVVKASIAGKILGVANPALAQIAAVNTANNALQKGGDFAQEALRFGQEGLGSLSQRVDDSRFDFLNVPSTALAVSGQALGLGDRAIEGVQGIGQGFTGDVNVLGGEIVDQFGRPIRFIDRQIDKGVGALRNLFNFFRRDDDDRRDDDPPVVVVDPNAVSQTFTTGGGGTGGGGTTGGTTGTTPGPAGMGFAPPPASRPTSGMTYRNVINRAEGGLATIPRYLKGR